MPTLDMFSFLQPSAFHSIDRWAEFLALLGKPLQAERLTEIACRRTGRTDFGTFDIEEPLKVLTAAYEHRT